MLPENVIPYLVPLVVAALALAGYAIALRVGQRAAPDRWQWFKDWVAPLTTALVILLLGTILQIAASERQATAQRLEREAAVMQEVMTSQDRRDIAHVVAATKQILIHLQRWQALERVAAEGRSLQRGTGAPLHGRRVAATQHDDFDEIAVYFFVSMLRAADVDFEATRGSVSFRRVWMEDRFHRLVHELLEHMLGGEARDIALPAQEEAAQYRYFGRHAVPVLWDFHGLVTQNTRSASVLEGEALRRGYERFRARLASGAIRVGKVDSTFRAMDGLWAYALNDVFAEWYGRTRDVLPDAVPPSPPKYFLKGDEARRDSLWAMIRRAKGAW